MKHILILWVMALSFAINGCEDIGDPVAPADDPNGGSAMSYGNDILPIFNSNCTTICHLSPASPGFGNLDLNSYDTLMDQTGPNHAPVIIPGDPDSSYLMKRIEDTIAPQMPLGLPELSSEQINQIRQWIQEGALDN